MTIRDLDHKNVCLLGYGREGRATLVALRHFAPNTHITIADANPDLTGEPGCALITGPHYLEQLSKFDVIIKTPGIAWHPEPKIAAHLTSATELFLNSLPPGTNVIGITGTKGKSTTAHLIHHILAAAGRHAVLAGNIGEPMISHLENITPDTIFVLELSSYQLETLHTSPQIAVITSFFPDHQDYHGSLEAYRAAKRHIAEFQRPENVVFFNDDSVDCRELASASPGRHIAFTAHDFPGRPPAALAGDTNRHNLAAAYLVALECGIPAASARHALETAPGLPHRQQVLGQQHGLRWIDDSAATTPQSTLAALNAFQGQINTILVGGLDRDYDYAELGRTLASSPVVTVILFPNTGAKIRTAIEAAHPHPAKTYFETTDMDEAVSFALGHTPAGGTCLLASGAPSYNLFKDYPARGQAFQTAIARAKTPNRT